MAIVNREALGTLHEKVSVQLQKEDYLPQFEQALKNYAKTANIPGFRKGAVPSGVVKKMVGKSLFYEQIVKTASKHLEDHLRSEKIVIFGQPMMMATTEKVVVDMEHPVDVKFDFEIGLKPNFSIKPIQERQKLKAYNIAITPELLADEIDRIQRRSGVVEEQPTITSNDDIVYCHFYECDAEGKIVSGAHKIEETVLFDKVPQGLKPQLDGKGPDTKVVFRPVDVCTEEDLPKFLKDPLKAPATHADHHYVLTLTKVGKLIPMAMGEELYEKVFPGGQIKEEEAFKEVVSQQLAFEYARFGRERLHNEIFELLVHNTDISIPVPFLKRWLKEGGEKPKSELEVEHEFSTFEHQLRWQLITDKIISENKLQVTRKDVLDDVKVRVLQYFGVTDEADAPWINTYMNKVVQDEKMMDETYKRLQTDRLFGFLEQQFEIEMVQVTEEEFSQLPSAHAAHHHHHH